MMQGASKHAGQNEGSWSICNQIQAPDGLAISIWKCHKINTAMSHSIYQLLTAISTQKSHHHIVASAPNLHQ
jgi:uncharacterized protein YhfF